METKLFFIGLGILIFTLILRKVHSAKYINILTVVVFHIIFCALVGIIVGLIVATVTNKAEVMTRFAMIGTLVGAISGFIQVLLSKNYPKLLKKDLEWCETTWSALLFAAVIMHFIIQAFKIPSGSMRKTLIEGDHLFVNKFIYGFHVPFTAGKRVLPLKQVQRKDIIVFRCPEVALDIVEREKKIKKDFIKRAIALPGEMVEIVDKKVYINKSTTPLEEPYANFEDKYIQPKVKICKTNEEYQRAWEMGRFRDLPVRDNFGPVVVPPGHYFVLGDNRDRSFDSRFWGPLPDRYLKGQALIIYWPIPRIKIIK